MTAAPRVDIRRLPVPDQQTIKPIETQYKGYRFRSRLEARWAVFFDALGINWTYEPDGYRTSEGLYLPDFLIAPGHGFRSKCYAEVKPTKDHINLPLMVAFHNLVETDLLLLTGPPSFDYYLLLHRDYDGFDPGHFSFAPQFADGDFGRSESFILNIDLRETDPNDEDEILPQIRRTLDDVVIPYERGEDNPKRFTSDDILHHHLVCCPAIQMVAKAILASRGARFEHSETPVTKKG